MSTFRNVSTEDRHVAVDGRWAHAKVDETITVPDEDDFAYECQTSIWQLVSGPSPRLTPTAPPAPTTDPSPEEHE